MQARSPLAVTGPASCPDHLEARRRRIALQMTKDMLDESSFEASPAHAVPGPIGKAGAKITDKLRRHAED
jgi:hypothetical protein